MVHVKPTCHGSKSRKLNCAHCANYRWQLRNPLYCSELFSSAYRFSVTNWARSIRWVDIRDMGPVDKNKELPCRNLWENEILPLMSYSVENCHDNLEDWLWEYYRNGVFGLKVHGVTQPGLVKLHTRLRPDRIRDELRRAWLWSQGKI